MINIATTRALTTVINKIFNVTNLNWQKGTDHNHKYITTPEFNKLTAEISFARLSQPHLVKNTNFDNKLINLRKTKSNKTKHVLVENNFKKWQVLVLIYFHGKSHFEQHFSQRINILKELVILMIVFYDGNLKDCLM